jgi:hypothetical protein
MQREARHSHPDSDEGLMVFIMYAADTQAAGIYLDKGNLCRRYLFGKPDTNNCGEREVDGQAGACEARSKRAVTIDLC